MIGFEEIIVSGGGDPFPEDFITLRFNIIKPDVATYLGFDVDDAEAWNAYFLDAYGIATGFTAVRWHQDYPYSIDMAGNLDTVYDFNFSGNYIVTNAWLEKMENLENLNLSENPMSQATGWDRLENLLTVDFSSCEFSQMPNLPVSVRELNMDYNMVHEANIVGFEYPNLKKLHIAGQFYLGVTPVLNLDHPTLEEFWCDANNLTGPDNFFEGLPGLTLLHAGFNGFEEITTSAPDLDTLVMDFCPDLYLIDTNASPKLRVISAHNCALLEINGIEQVLDQPQMNLHLSPDSLVKPFVVNVLQYLIDNAIVPEGILYMNGAGNADISDDATAMANYHYLNNLNNNVRCNPFPIP